MAFDNFQSSSTWLQVYYLNPFTSFPKLFLFSSLDHWLHFWLVHRWSWRDHWSSFEKQQNPPPTQFVAANCTPSFTFLSKRAQTGVWAPFDLFSSFSASLGFGFGFAGGGAGVVATRTGSGSGAFLTSVSGSFTRVSHCQNCSNSSILLHLFKKGV